MLHAYSDKRHDGGEEGRKGPDKVEKIEALLLVKEKERKRMCVSVCVSVRVGSNTDKDVVGTL